MNSYAELVWYLEREGSLFDASPMLHVFQSAEENGAKSDRCHSCSGSGVNDDRFRGEIGDWCKYCGGSGFVPFTMRRELFDCAFYSEPTFSVYGCHESVEDAIAKYIDVGRLLDRMSQRLAYVMCVAYGSIGERVSSSIRGRSWSCMHLTDGGRKLLEHILRTNRHMSIGDIIIETSSNGIIRDIKRECLGLVLDATTQSIELLGLAESEWMQVTGGAS